MPDKRIWKYILVSLAWVTSLVGLMVLMSFIATKKAAVVCKEIKVFTPGNQYFIDKQEVDAILSTNGNEIVGRRLETINIQDLEDKLKANPFIEYAKVYAEMDGTIYVDISQRKPLLRIMNNFQQDFYVDQHGLKIPLSDSFTSKVLAANGYIDEMYTNRLDTLHTPIAKEIFKTASFIKKDSLWDAQIAQIYVNKDHEIELVPRVGNNRILIGDADSLDAKFKNLLIFYKKVLPRVGWDAYKVINVKYANQVIGVKNRDEKTDSLKTKKPGIDSTKLKKETSLIKE
jgi:cell division protein FtsQ